MLTLHDDWWLTKKKWLSWGLYVLCIMEGCWGNAWILTFVSKIGGSNETRGASKTG